MTAKEYLEQLIIRDRAIIKKRQRLETLHSVAMNTTVNYGNEAVQHSKAKNPLENIMAKIVDLDREIEDDVNSLVDLKAEVWERLDNLRNEPQKRVLWLHYAERLSWSKVANALNFSERYVYILHRRALSELDKILKVDRGSSVSVQ